MISILGTAGASGTGADSTVGAGVGITGAGVVDAATVPADAGIIEDVVRELSGEFPILGVCLGHQAICEAFGAEITYAKELMHGKQSVAELDRNCPIFGGLADKEKVARYHSLAADPATMPSCLKVVARTDDGEIMAVAHEKYPTYGLQFHPESILTPNGAKMVGNFLGV